MNEWYDFTPMEALKISDLMFFPIWEFVVINHFVFGSDRTRPQSVQQHLVMRNVLLKTFYVHCGFCLELPSSYWAQNIEIKCAAARCSGTTFTEGRRIAGNSGNFGLPISYLSFITSSKGPQPLIFLITTSLLIIIIPLLHIQPFLFFISTTVISPASLNIY